MHFNWTSSSRHCSSAAEIFHFGLIRIHSNARNSIIANSASEKVNEGVVSKETVSLLSQTELWRLMNLYSRAFSSTQRLEIELCFQRV